MKKISMVAAISLAVLNPINAFACANGCGIFNVGTSSLIPTEKGGIAFLQYDYLNQNQNWHNQEKSDAENHDKKIQTQVVTAGTQYMFNRKWGAAIRVPVMTRYVEKMSEDEEMEYARHSAVGDITINGIYSGFSDDMSSGITFGLKLPTGSTNDKSFERNTQIGTGSTDSVLGAYHMGRISEKWNYFAQGSWERAFITHQGYKPGSEISGATGVYFNAGAIGVIDKVAPILQITGTRKSHDSGYNSDSQNSGYSQAFISPAIEFNFCDFKLYADVRFPFYRSVNGQQLVADRMYKVILGKSF
jgi:hypothetical protein